MKTKHGSRSVEAPCTSANFVIETHFSMAALGLREYVSEVHGKVPACWVLFIAGL